MSKVDEVMIDSDAEDPTGIQVVSDGKTYQITFLSFPGVPLQATLIVPKKQAKAALKKFIKHMQEREDVYAALIDDFVVEHEPAPAKKSPGKKPIKPIRMKP